MHKLDFGKSLSSYRLSNIEYVSFAISAQVHLQWNHGDFSDGIIMAIDL